MDDRHFDSLVKSLATGRNRRSVLKGLLGLGGAAMVGSAASTDAGAARRPTPTPKPITCPGSQIWDGSACICPSGRQCGPACCTGEAVCCDNACCNGQCYGEELCCPFGNFVCEGECIPAIEGACCTGADCGSGQACIDGQCRDACIPLAEDGCSPEQRCCDGLSCQQGVCVPSQPGTCQSGSILCGLPENPIPCGGGCMCLTLPDGTNFCSAFEYHVGECPACAPGDFCVFDDCLGQNWCLSPCQA